MFRVLNNSNVENAIYVQGARIPTSSESIASIVFQNHDVQNDTTNNMASISLFGSNGYGDLVFKTLESTLAEKMRISYNGNVNIGNPTSTRGTLNVAGAIFADGPILANNINSSEIITSNVSTESYKTQRIIFTKLSTSNFVNNLVVMLNSNQAQFDAANIISGQLDVNRIPYLDASKISTGQLSTSLFPSSLVLNTIATSNLYAYTQTATPRLSFTKGSNNTIIATGSNINITASNIDAWGKLSASTISLGYPIQGDSLYAFKNFDDWVPTTSTSNVTLSVIHSRYGFINNMTTIHFSYMLSINTPSISNIVISLPSAPAYTISRAIFFTDLNGNDILGKLVLDNVTQMMFLKSTTLTMGHWSVTESITYETVA